MNFKGVEICCPHCRGELVRARIDTLACRSCGRTFPVLLEIPDLRIFPDPYISFDEDRAKAARLAERFSDFDFEGFVDFYYRNTPAVPPRHARLYKRGLLAAPARTQAWLGSWEAAVGNGDAEALLEVGCGTAPLLLAARDYKQRVGVDIAFRWLVVGKKRLSEAGLDLPLICACAEALPFPDAGFDRVVADSALEHFTDQARALAECHRVLRRGGRAFVATPNRWSLGPDPQTGILAGGWLPNRVTAAIVRRQGGVPPVRRLVGARALRRLLRSAGFDGLRIFLPEVPQPQRELFSPMMKQLAAVYELALRFPPSRWLLYCIGPMLHAVATRPGGPQRHE